ncbi:hypothetical protein [Sphingomonas sp. CFBP 13733]|jgi:hypothetical protein|uniref:hypothetical protein n=1 Tax=Sphingomonas sp. CFBP 13733 TaxID=2775291 RepID=UPI00177A9FD7|nr:hypothetical protein [Sphingomonas sp. CFBP 13733]MBD8641012.1 hypothetical protein [Sphingomonas sp. CFBP 13733]
MRWTDLPTALVISLWGYLLYAGIGGLCDIKAQHVPGYPASGQMILYAGVPVLALLLLMGAVVLSRKARWFYDLYPFTVGLVAFLIFPVLMFWGGGV